MAFFAPVLKFALFLQLLALSLLCANYEMKNLTFIIFVAFKIMRRDN